MHVNTLNKFLSVLLVFLRRTASTPVIGSVGWTMLSKTWKKKPPWSSKQSESFISCSLILDEEIFLGLVLQPSRFVEGPFLSWARIWLRVKLSYLWSDGNIILQIAVRLWCRPLIAAGVFQSFALLWCWRERFHFSIPPKFICDVLGLKRGQN